MKTAHDIILKPVITENSMAGIADKKYTFKVATDATKVEIAQAVEVLFLDFHTVKVGYFPLDRLDRFVVVDTLNVQIDDNPVFRVHEVGKHTVGEFRRDDLQKGNRTKLAAHLKHSPVAKSERGRCDKVLDGKPACG